MSNTFGKMSIQNEISTQPTIYKKIIIKIKYTEYCILEQNPKFEKSKKGYKVSVCVRERKKRL